MQIIWPEAECWTTLCLVKAASDTCPVCLHVMSEQSADACNLKPAPASSQHRHSQDRYRSLPSIPSIPSIYTSITRTCKVPLAAELATAGMYRYRKSLQEMDHLLH
jgi:hypothetical protein